MNIIFVRHGESEFNAKVKNTYSKESMSDDPLTKKGRNQTEALGKALKKYKVSEIYTSNLKRAKETGRIISSIIKVPVKENLEELDEYPTVYLRSGLRHMLDINERRRERKLKKFLKKISKEKNEDKTILIVAHGITNRIIMKHLSRFPLRKKMFRFSQHNTCINILKWSSDFNNWQVKCVNNIEHLPIKLRETGSLI